MKDAGPVVYKTACAAFLSGKPFSVSKNEAATELDDDLDSDVVIGSMPHVLRGRRLPGFQSLQPWANIDSDGSLREEVLGEAEGAAVNREYRGEDGRCRYGEGLCEESSEYDTDSEDDGDDDEESQEGEVTSQAPQPAPENTSAETLLSDLLTTTPDQPEKHSKQARNPTSEYDVDVLLGSMGVATDLPGTDCNKVTSIPSPVASSLVCHAPLGLECERSGEDTGTRIVEADLWRSPSRNVFCHEQSKSVNAGPQD